MDGPNHRMVPPPWPPRTQAGEPEEALAALDRALRATADPPPEVLELRNEVAATLLAMDRERAAEGAEAA